MQSYGIAKDVLIEFQDSSTLVDFMVMDMDPHQQTSIILGNPFLKSVKVTIDKKRRIINMKVDRVHEKFIYHPKNLACCCQIQVHRYVGSWRVRCVEVLLEHMRSHPQSWNKRPRNAMTPDKKHSVAENFRQNFLDTSRMPHLLQQVLQSHRWPKSSGIEMVLLTDLKCDALARRINQ
jgi:hypothetical protein